MLLEDYKTFCSVEDLNAAIYTHLCNHWDDLTDTDRKTIKILARYAVKFPGAAHLKAATMGDLIGKSEKTARRVLNKLQQLGIIRKIGTIRPKSKGTGANVIQILQPADHPESQHVQAGVDDMSRRSDSNSTHQTSADDGSGRKESSIHKASKKSTIDTQKQTDPDDNAALSNAIPGELFAAMRPYFGAQELYKKIGILWRSKAAAGGSDVFIEDHVQHYADAFRYAILMLKQRKIRNLDGYLFAAWRNTTTWIRRKTAAATGSVNPFFYDWLNEDKSDL
ncbi:helix-turn-helix domain-containing protein [Bacillus sp. UNC438CL73TsuS30]|uniref:helix-turn-helix domain-containing protein n=1 Tax=Bacillus sp. UNC438CL73TsuS30 TaxID=1340434 RepID=UPI00068BA2B4|nr:helix-turn-helix domain-containing protein [Bacillus sp. UNC438CL73TsuS30]